MNHLDQVLTILRTGVWHTTHPARAANIFRLGSIDAEPPIPDRFRWHTGQGAYGYSYARSIGAVSLFDFRGFDDELYSKQNPISSWRTFVPSRWQFSVWIGIATDRLDTFLSTEQFLDSWRNAREFRRSIMPSLESAHVGSISYSAFSKAILVDQKSMILEIALPDDHRAAARALIEIYKGASSRQHATE